MCAKLSVFFYSRILKSDRSREIIISLFVYKGNNRFHDAESPKPGCRYTLPRIVIAKVHCIHILANSNRPDDPQS